ncbi:MAG: AMP-binding protein, partial [Halieaceae bacterium]|nr:AMP-binding protein [Halieaceae bacterium]
PLLSEVEQKRLVQQWNATDAEYPADQCIHELFEAQVTKTPEATALECGSQVISYAELNARANQLAHYLRDRDVGPEILVGVCLERSIEMVVAVLGVLKAGGAYVPLDPGYPKARLTYMIEDAALKLVIADASNRRVLPNDTIEIVDLTAGNAAVTSSFPVTNPVNQTHPENLAYVIYTSGSTGQPKGVMALHRG